MISQKYLFSILFLVAALCILCHASPVPTEVEPSTREGRFYGMGGSQASAMAMSSAGAGGFGYPGYGMGGASSFASANALGYGGMYGK